jgi:hypothetical protein
MINVCLQRQMTDIAQGAMEDPDSVPPSPEEDTDESGLVPPSADNNVMKITEDCLFVRTAHGRMMGGRYSMTWWATEVAVFSWGLANLFAYNGYNFDVLMKTFHGSFFEYYFFGKGNFALWGPSVFIVGSFWMFIYWRMQLPIIFNRKTQKVTAYIKGKIFTQSWEKMCAEVATSYSPIYGGVPIREGVLRLFFPYKKGRRKKREYEMIGVSATMETKAAHAHPGSYGAAQIWAYICLFMHEGAVALPPFEPDVAKYRQDRFLDSFKCYNPMQIFPKDKLLYPISLPFFFFFIVPCSILAIIGDLLYTAFDRILPKRKWPQELLDACDNVWDGSGD